MPRKKTVERPYTTVSLPTGLVQKIDAIVEDSKYGYQNRVDFILEAVRKRMREMGLLE